MSNLNYNIENFDATSSCADIKMPTLSVVGCSPHEIKNINEFKNARTTLMAGYKAAFLNPDTAAEEKHNKCLLEKIINLIKTNSEELQTWSNEINKLDNNIKTNNVLIMKNDDKINTNKGYRLIKENRLVSSAENKNIVNKEFIIYIVLIVFFLIIQICLIVF